jgi:3-oxoacyl-[acyl-carrier protein] reductase
MLDAEPGIVPPGFVRAADLQQHDVDRQAATGYEAIPIGRANQPEDIAAMAVFLASPGARNITGQAYNVDGGLVPS